MTVTRSDIWSASQKLSSTSPSTRIGTTLSAAAAATESSSANAATSSSSADASNGPTNVRVPLAAVSDRFGDEPAQRGSERERRNHPDHADDGRRERGAHRHGSSPPTGFDRHPQPDHSLRRQIGACDRGHDTRRRASAASRRAPARGAPRGQRGRGNHEGRQHGNAGAEHEPVECQAGIGLDAAGESRGKERRRARGRHHRQCHASERRHRRRREQR